MEDETWLLDLSQYFSMQPYSSNTKARCAIMHLCDFASTWWRIEERKIGLDITTISWELFLERFRARFLSEHWRQRKADEFHNLRQDRMIVDEYEQRFFELRQYIEIVADETMFVYHFVRGLKDYICREVCMHEPKTLHATIEKARIIEENHSSSAGDTIGG
ncbi:uncharacterized protein LOC131875155 [Cryptomeria japonica]|uniref:uncharacterized protein LOC131875155 n=1 Tax=Cryptomeria japonica TaxID=3369 RepID=UPI0027DA56AB|nr:uncharacterized protein LOC131875155 [Cryptomeria japonica]